MARPRPISSSERFKEATNGKKPVIAAKGAAKPVKKKKSSKKELEERMQALDSKYREYRARRDAVISLESNNISLTGNITG